MKNELSDPAFYPFFMKKLQERLSGSSVMPIDQAERIQQSIEFVLKNGGEGSLSQQFEQGKQQLMHRLKRLKQLYEEILAKYQSFGIESLEESLREIGNFFKEYDLDYGAAEVDQAFLDYQLAEAVPANFIGLDFYERYLQNLAAEVFFIANVPENQIYELLENYQDKLGFDYRQDVNNLFELVFRQVVGKLVIDKKENDSLLLNRIEAQYALNQLKLESIPTTLNQLFKVNEYYHRVFEQLRGSLRRLEEPEKAFGFFLTIAPPKKQLELSPSMPSNCFNRLIEAYSIADQQEKIRLISMNISAPTDFEEFLSLTSEKPEFYQELLKELNKDFIKTLILYETKKEWKRKTSRNP
ncbi:DUF6179 domain-containing protein [Enterococcus raffinosus]|uniref:DUF6179 domain-containing protein n=1 Tax=Enterococcus raffinosus TaxID=71452 RepID=UPI00209EEDEF|nr:DUF6179 domain-containing protein [Enterococcus raffinosus]